MPGTLNVGGHDIITHSGDAGAGDVTVNVQNRLVLDSSGNVGIGTSSPQGDLDVRNGTNQTVIIGNSGGYGGGEYGRLMFKEASTELAYLQWNGTGNEFRLMNRIGILTFGTSNNEKMRIDSSGNVIVGGAGSGSLGKLHTRADGGTPLSVSNENASGTLVVFMGNGSGDRGSITHNGSTIAYNTSSDYRLKENITDITDGISRVKQLNPSRFNFIVDPDRTVDGFIAHEVQGIVPEAITGEKDAVNEDGSINPQGIDQSKLVPLLTAALQEAISKIEALTTRIEALENA